jgi:hypothetical protein
LFKPILFRFIGVEHGTASRWCELLGMAGTQPDDFFAATLASLHMLQQKNKFDPYNIN